MEHINQEDRGGRASIVMRYSIQQRCVRAKIAIPFRGIVVRVSCALCGYVGFVHEYNIWTATDHRLPEVWMCDVCGSQIRN